MAYRPGSLSLWANRADRGPDERYVMSFGHRRKGGAGASAAAPVNSGKSNAYISLMALTMMNVTIVAGLGNDVQQSFYGLTSVTYFTLGAIFFFIPTGLVAAELAGGWSERGGIFRWVGEGIGPGWAFVCVFLLWFQTTFNFGAGAASFGAGIGFFTPDYDWAVQQALHPQWELPLMCCWLAFYWFICWLATKGVKVFAKVANYGVLIGTFIPLCTIIVLSVVWLCQGRPIEFMKDPEVNTLIPHWEGLSTLALAAGVFFSFTGIDMNAAHIKSVKNPRKTYPLSIFFAMILALIIFMVGTLIIAMVIPNDQINVIYALNETYKNLGATIGIPWLYMVFVYAGLGATIANLITNLAGPSVMLGSAGKSGFLPKRLNNTNKGGMPSHLMYFQMALMSGIAFLVFLIPNIEGFVVLVSQAITVLYLLYYVLMFLAFIRLKYNQPNRPRSFTVPGGKVGAWIVFIVGEISCIFGIVLSFVPPAQIASEVGNGFNYVMIIAGLTIFVLAVSWGIYFASRKHDWVDPTNKFAPFTWEIEGLKKPQKVLSNVPADLMSRDQNPMGMPIKHHYDPNEQIDPKDLPDDEEGLEALAKARPITVHQANREAFAHVAAQKVVASTPGGSAVSATLNDGSLDQITPAIAASEKVAATVPIPKVDVPAAPLDQVRATTLPEDARTAAAREEDEAQRFAIAAEALKEEASAERDLADAREKAKEAKAAAEQAVKAAGFDEKPPEPAHETVGSSEAKAAAPSEKGSKDVGTSAPQSGDASTPTGGTSAR